MRIPLQSSGGGDIPGEFGGADNVILGAKGGAMFVGGGNGCVAGGELGVGGGNGGAGPNGGFCLHCVNGAAGGFGGGEGGWKAFSTHVQVRPGSHPMSPLSV